MTRHFFDQLLAEAMDRYGISVETLTPLVEAAVERYGWPIPDQHLDAAAKMILLPLRRGLRA